MLRPVRSCWLLGLFAFFTLAAGPAAAAEAVTVHLDRATLVKVPEAAGTIIVGNPLIADVNLQAGGTLVVTGKGYGATNLVVLDRHGNVLTERTVQVQGPRDPVVFVYRGTDRETYSCQPRCERRITLGDTPKYFSDTLTQTTQRNGMAAGGGSDRRAGQQLPQSQQEQE